MTKLQLFRLLRHNIRTGGRRSLLFEANLTAKVFTFIGVGLACIYLIALGTMLGLAASGSGAGVIFAVMPIVLVVDFCMRVSMQKTPSVFLKPYMLLPIRRTDVTDCFLLSMQTSSGNMIWLCLFVPYTIIAACGGTSVLTSLAVMLACQLLVSANSLFYLIVRTLASRSILWWLLPLIIYGAIAAAGFMAGLSRSIDLCCRYGLTIWAIITYTLIAIALFRVARSVIDRFACDEIARTDSTKLRGTPKLAFLNRYGLIGEYIRMELKSTMRNKVVSRSFVTSLIFITVISCLIAYTDLYDNMSDYWCLYSFAIIGVINLSRIMGPEGNYIDLLMVHNQNIYTLLRAKYYFYCAILILPALLLLPTVISGKYPPMMIPANMLMTSGVEYFILFQLAVYNKQTIPLDRKIAGNGRSNSGLQTIASLTVLLLPAFAAITMTFIFGEDTAYIILAAIGLVFTLTNRFWLRNIYSRMMKRRYSNIEGFHETRLH